MKKIILIVGASGVGKDTLLRKTKAKIEANFIQRYITRRPDSNESNYYLDETAFITLEKENYFASSWRAHGNLYGIARDHILEGINIISVSRTAVPDFENAYSNVTTIHITLPDEKLYERLYNRKRESEDEIQKRIDRSKQSISSNRLIRFDNSLPIDISCEKFISLIQKVFAQS